MQVTNIRMHRIRWRRQLARGAVVGAISAVVLLLVTALAWLIVADSGNGWTLFDVGGSIALGLLAQLGIGVIAGMGLAALVALFDLEGWTPVALTGLLYGAVLFVWPAALIGADDSATATDEAALLVTFAGSIAFGLTAGMLLATWADRGDIDQDEAERVAAFEGDEPGSHHHLIG